MSIAAIGFILIPKTRKLLFELTFKQFGFIVLIGAIICIHWLCFYHSIKVFNSSSIALICLGTSSMFVIWIEYFVKLRARISIIDIAISLVSIVGMALIFFGNEKELADIEYSNFKLAIFYGTMAALLAAVFTIMNKSISNTVSPYVISFTEMMTGAIILLIYIFFQSSFVPFYQISYIDWVYILILSIICTNIPFLLSVFALKKLNPFIVTLSVNLEPIYGIIFAALFFNELANFNSLFFVGAFLILVSVFLPLIFKNKIA